MAIHTTIDTLPSLQIAADDIGIAKRIHVIDEQIHANPEDFMQSCRILAGVALEYMPTAEEAPLAHPKIVHSLHGQLREFLDYNDLKYAQFDPDTDSVIYAHPGVKHLIQLTREAKGQRVKHGRNYQARENPLAVQRRDTLSALKLYLYAKRTRTYYDQISSPAALGYDQSDVSNGAA